MENPSPKSARTAKVHDMTREELREELAPLLSRMTVLETKVSALPDKAAVLLPRFRCMPCSGALSAGPSAL